MRKVGLVVAGLILLGWYTQPSEEGSDASGVAPGAASTPSASAPEKGSPVGPRSNARPHDAPDRTAKKSSPRKRAKRHRVVDVVDGDTVHVAYRGSDVSVRVIGIDTPETVHPSEPVECGGPQASATATRLLSGKKVSLVFDPSQGRTDSYGRTLAYIEAPGIGDFGLAMIRRGKAAEYTYDTSYARQARYLAAEDAAQADRRGIWDRCGGVDTPLRSEPRPVSRAPQKVSGGGGVCDPGYDPCVPPSSSDLDCADVDGPVRVITDDPHGFDADGDGVGCDS